ncbi:MAG: DUF2442 domain-containing protein [Anaerolineae bacterium]|nr:DUF2442 domain-containing protein [Anaerolineae bacterium]
MTQKSEMNLLQNNRRPTHVTITTSDVIITLDDGSKISNPIDWHPWLRDASSEQQQDYKVYAFAIYWQQLDEGLDIEGMLRGIRPRYPHTEKIK